MNRKTILILGANSDVARELLKLYIEAGHFVIAASRNLDELKAFVLSNELPADRIDICYFDAVDFSSHEAFYRRLKFKPNVVIYAAGFQVTNDNALINWEGTYQMMNVHYAGAVSILNLIVADNNKNLERIVGLSSLSGVRGRKSNFVYGSTKAAFTQYLAGMRQHLFERKVMVNVIVAGYIRSKMTAGLDLNESLMLEPSFVARSIFNAGRSFAIVPGWKWKIIYQILRLMPEQLVARLP